jgi:hypothetical protein
MTGSHWIAALSALTVSMAGCGAKTVVDTHGTGGGGTGGQGTAQSPLVGVWNGGATFAPTVLSEHMTLDADGTATATDTFALIGGGVGVCKGELDITDMWSATSTTLSVSGGTCSGQAVCPNGNTIPCGPSETASQTCTYTLSNGGDTLVLSCPEAQGPITYTRQH